MNIRLKISNWLIRLAYRIRPDNPELIKAIADQVIYGSAFTRIDPSRIYKED